MEPIITGEFALSKKDYSNIMLTLIFKSRLKVYLPFIVFAFFLWLNSSTRAAELYFKFIIILSILLPIAYYLMVRSFVRHKDNRFMFSLNKFTFNENKFTVTDVEENTNTEIVNKRIVRKKKLKNHYLLYINKTHAYMIPEEVFQSEEDKQRFRELFNFKD